MISGKERVHFIGIGGIGMSGIAQILMDMGCAVSGSDLKSSALIEKLRYRGAEVHIGHAKDNVGLADLVIYTPAVSRENPELREAQARKLPLLSRAEALAILANQKKTIAVTGAHGKTTTSSLVSHLLFNCGFKPTICVGGEVFSLNGNAFSGSGNFFVLEADESDGSFLTLNPLYSIITNIDKEHLDYYRDFEHITETFKRFMLNNRDEGALFCCKDDRHLMQIADSLPKEVISFGLSDQADIFARDIEMKEQASSFVCVNQGKEIGEVKLNIPGQHNISNSLAVIALGLKLDIDFGSIKKGLESYKGVRRRMEIKLREREILVLEDYAHHPTEIKATLAALKNFKHKRMIAVFQPHRYSRTKFLLDEFGRSFQGVDRLIVTDIYAASERPLEGVDAREICQRASRAGVKEAIFLPKYDILKKLLEETRSGDLIVVMGAGDIGSLSDVLAEEIKKTNTF